MGAISFWYLWTIWLRKKVKNLILKKSKISGVAQNGSISADGIFRVANFGFQYLRHFFNNFANSCAHLVANFLNFSKHPQHLSFDGFEGSYGQKTKKIRYREICHFEPTLKSNLFWEWDFSSFFIIIWSYGISTKTNRKYLKIPDLQALTLGRVKKITLYNSFMQLVLCFNFGITMLKV